MKQTVKKARRDKGQPYYYIDLAQMCIIIAYDFRLSWNNIHYGSNNYFYSRDAATLALDEIKKILESNY